MGIPDAARRRRATPCGASSSAEAALLLRGPRARRRGPRARAGHRGGRVSATCWPPSARTRTRAEASGVDTMSCEARRDGRVGVPDRRQARSTPSTSPSSTPAWCSGPSVSVEILLRPIVGGRGRCFGPLLGSGRSSRPCPRRHAALIRGRPGIDVMVYGALLVIVITFLPGGLVGAWRRIFRQRGPWRPRQA